MMIFLFVDSQSSIYLKKSIDEKSFGGIYT